MCRAAATCMTNDIRANNRRICWNAGFPRSRSGRGRWKRRGQMSSGRRPLHHSAQMMGKLSCYTWKTISLVWHHWKKIMIKTQLRVELFMHASHFWFRFLLLVFLLGFVFNFWHFILFHWLCTSAVLFCFHPQTKIWFEKMCKNVVILWCLIHSWHCTFFFVNLFIFVIHEKKKWLPCHFRNHWPDSGGFLLFLLALLFVLILKAATLTNK